MESRERFEALYSEHAGLVRAFARRRASDGDAHDVVAEVFLAAWRRLDEVPTDPLPWLLSVARGVLANRRRAGARANALQGRLIHEQLAGTARRADAGSDDAAVLQALESLTDRDRELLLLIAWDGLERRQVAELLGLTTGTVGVRLHRARRRFARALAAQDARQQIADPQPSTEASW